MMGRLEGFVGFWGFFWKHFLVESVLALAVPHRGWAVGPPGRSSRSVSVSSAEQRRARCVGLHQSSHQNKLNF